MRLGRGRGGRDHGARLRAGQYQADRDQRPDRQGQPDEGPQGRAQPPPPPGDGDLLSYGHDLAAVQPAKDGEQRSEARVVVRQRFLDLVKCAPLARWQAHHAVLARFTVNWLNSGALASSASRSGSLASAATDTPSRSANGWPVGTRTPSGSWRNSSDAICGGASEARPTPTSRRSSMSSWYCSGPLAPTWGIIRPG